MSNAKTMSVYYLLSRTAIIFYSQSLISELHGAKRIVRLTPKVMTSPNELTASSFMLVFPVLRPPAVMCARGMPPKGVTHMSHDSGIH